MTTSFLLPDDPRGFARVGQGTDLVPYRAADQGGMPCAKIA